MKKISPLVNSLQYRAIKLRYSILNTISIAKYSSLIEKLDSAPDFPSVAASKKQLIEIMFEGSKRSLVELNRLCGVTPLKVVEYKTDKEGGDADELMKFKERLKLLFDEYGSDKGSGHEYHHIYAEILWNRKNLRILEIGLGSNRLEIPSNMGIHGKPGASLKAFQSLGDVKEIIGLDIDKEVLFSDGKISTYQLDQVDRNSWRRVKQVIGNHGFDLIIDDGLHSPLANIITISECLEMLKVGGYLVTEDIPTRSLPVWEMYLHKLSDNLEAHMYKFRRAHLLQIKKIA
jgi:hypothetical protein